MKKSALTIALFSLTMVLTSFTTVETSNSLSIEKTAQDPPIGGVCAGCGNKKLDVAKSESSSNATAVKTNSFNTDTQSLGNYKKLD